MLETHQEYDVILFTRIDIGIQETAIYDSNWGFKSLPREDFVNNLYLIDSRYLGAYRLRTFLEQFNFKVKVLEYPNNYNYEELFALLDKFVTKKTKIIGANSTFGQFNDKLHLVNNFILQCKKRYSHIKWVVGGQNCLTIKNKLPDADIFVNGFGENALLAILEDKVDKNETELDGTFGYGFPNEYFTQWKEEDGIYPEDALPIETARGCIFACKFCSFPLVGKKKNEHVATSDDLKRQFLNNYEKFGVTKYNITEETFNDNLFKLENILNITRDLPFELSLAAFIKPELLVAKPEMIDMLVEMGLEGCSIGTESLNPESRKAVGKGYTYEKIKDALVDLKKKSHKRGKLGFGIVQNIIIGLPYETQETFAKGVEYLINAYECDRLVLHILNIRKSDDVWTYTSPIDKNPESFGYDIWESNRLPDSYEWKNNEDLNSTNSRELLEKYYKTIFWNNTCHGFYGPINGMRNGLHLPSFYKLQEGKNTKLTKQQRDFISRNLNQRVRDYYNYQLSM